MEATQTSTHLRGKYILVALTTAALLSIPLRDACRCEERILAQSFWCNPTVRECSNPAEELDINLNKSYRNHFISPPPSSQVSFSSATMCTTRRYHFLCSHPATHRFRDTVCESSSLRGCQVRDYDVYLQHPCQKCSKRGMASVRPGFANQECAFEDTWYVPRRCFVDVGFHNLNPFDEEKPPEPPSTLASPVEQVVDQCPLTPPLPAPVPDDGPNLCQRLIRRLTKKKPSPCCAREARYGAYEAVRIKGRDHRVGGAMRENRCESPL